MNNRFVAEMMLFFVASFWGVSFLLTDIATADLEAFNLNAFRFLGAFMVAALFMVKKLKNISRETVLWSIFLGILMATMYVMMNLGVMNTTLSNSGFLCQTTVIVTPFLSAAITKKSPGLKTYIIALICITGIAMLTIDKDFSMDSAYMKGNIMCLMCGCVAACHIVLTGQAVKNEKVDPIQLAVLQLGTTGILSLVMSFIMETPHLPGSGKVWAAATVLAVVCSGIAVVIQTIAQKVVPPSHVSIIFTLEPVVAGFVAFYIGGEILSAQAYIGAALLLTGIIIMEIDFKSIIKQKEIKNGINGSSSK